MSLNVFYLVTAILFIAIIAIIGLKLTGGEVTAELAITLLGGMILTFVLILVEDEIITSHGEKTELLSVYKLISEEDDRYLQVSGGSSSSVMVIYITDENKIDGYNIERAKAVYTDDSNPRIEVCEYKWGFLKYKGEEIYLP